MGDARSSRQVEEDAVGLGGAPGLQRSAFVVPFADTEGSGDDGTDHQTGSPRPRKVSTGQYFNLTREQDASQQHAELIQEYNNLMDEFHKRYGMLADVQDKMNVKIRQVTGLRDGVRPLQDVFPPEMLTHI